RFRRHSTFNARLIQIQYPSANEVASADEWRGAGRTVLPDARPILILMPSYPVALVYELSDNVAASRAIPAWGVRVERETTLENQLATIAHHLGHVFCGHLGECKGWRDHGGWPDRTTISPDLQEMEAEAVSLLITRRAGLTLEPNDHLNLYVEAI